MSRETRNRKEKRNADKQAARSRRAQSYLEALGLWTWLKNTNLAKRLVTAHYPRIEVVLGDDELCTPEATAILQELDKTLRITTVDCPVLEKSISVDDFFSTVKPLLDALDVLVSDNASLQAHLTDARQRIRPLAADDLMATGILKSLNALEAVIIKYGRIDHRLYFIKVVHEFKSQKRVIRFVLRSHLCEARSVDPGLGPTSKPRPAFRCGQPFGLRGIDWVEWPASLMGIAESAKIYPVFVQSHALDNLYKKEARALFITDGEWLVHDYLWQSLRQPEIRQMAGHSRKYLVDYKLNAHRLGYLVAHQLDDLVLIESFLFLTMVGTPEGDLLHAKLRLTRTDRQYLELDRIQTFLFSDVQFDPELVELLAECGCGHLFKILIDPRQEHFRSGTAQEIRKFLQREGR